MRGRGFLITAAVGAVVVAAAQLAFTEWSGDLDGDTSCRSYAEDRGLQPSGAGAGEFQRWPPGRHCEIDRCEGGDPVENCEGGTERQTIIFRPASAEDWAFLVGTSALIGLLLAGIAHTAVALVGALRRATA